jgi:pimeloyl-ACP methyl ester carboxylesterase
MVVIIVILSAIYFAIQGIRCYLDLGKAKEKLNSYNKTELDLSYGKITYIDEGQGDVILSVHGMFGGYDQAYENIKSRFGNNRIIAPSRFGYLGSTTKGNGTPKEQAEAFKELLDTLKIDKVFIIGTSAGGTPAIRFALDYPERVKGLILYCSAMPVNKKPDKYSEYQAPPKLFMSNYAMYLISPLMPVIMGMPASTTKDIMPVAERKEGVILDGKIVNPDMERNFEEYPIEKLKVPTLIVHAEDDRLSSFKKVEAAIHRFPNLTLVTFPNGGHMMRGHGNEIDKALDNFVQFKT